ncbi:hypothetical protein [Nosocomiicoccus massiliensis]|uniref:hypothetical protein n=1 Tax=Nosocomiicoccus massiliensis TaxID=1232430 RepID=UPI0005935420|nr:hypothetical protein [Nosocomiicoccus massiliensis]
MKRIFVLIILSLLLTFVLNATDIYNIEFTITNLIYIFIFLVILMVIYKIIFRFIKTFAVLFILIIGAFILYYIYVYITGQPIESLEFLNNYLFKN